jgi:hypothetical protein
MNGTRHETVLRVLTQRAQQFHRVKEGPGSKGLRHAWEVDETGTLDMSGLCDINEKDAEYLEISEVKK